VLTSGEVVPVRISMRPPIIPLAYELTETAESLVPEPWMTGEWPWLSPAYWEKLDRVGVEAIAAELCAISDRHGGKDLCLVDYEDVAKGHRSLRLVFACWFEAQTGREVHELLDDGEPVHWSALPKRTRPKRAKRPGEERRWTDDTVREWPLSHEDVAEWIEGRHWQTARSLDHAYTRRDWGSEVMFLRVVLHVREHGQQEVFAGDIYSYHVVGNRKYWTMGSDLESTVILNRKELWRDGQEEGDEDTEKRASEVPQPDLFRAGPGEERA
jgi:hypothetical protein